MSTKLRVGIIGVGMVGEPLRKWFEEINGYKRGRDLFCYDADPKKSYKDDVNRADVVFVSVPTPPNPDGSCNTSIVESVVSQIKDGKIVIVKSTVEPGTVQRLQDKYPKKRFIFNPEFLTESQSWEDFISPDRQIVSTTSKSETDAIEVLNLLPRKNFIRPWTSDYSKKSVNTTEAEMGKYASNVFGFLKVAYGNILADLSHAMTLKYAAEKSRLPKGNRGSSIKSGKTVIVNYDNIKDLIAADLRIGPAWLNVNHGNYSGAGGYCLAPNERLLVFNSNKPKITFAKDLNANVVSVLGWNNGRVIKDKVTIIAKRLASSLIEFSLNKGRSISVTPDHIMIVSDKNGNLSQKCAKDVSPNDHIPVVLDGLRLESNSTVKIHEFIDSNKERVLVEKVPQKYAGELKSHLTKNEYRDFKRTRWNAIPIQACLVVNINIDNLRIKTGTSGTWIPASIKVDSNFARLIGYYLSEGCVTDNRVVFCFSVKEHDLIDDLSGILKGLGIKYSTKIRQWKGNDSSYSFKISSKIFSSFLSRTCGTNSYNKQIPYFLLESDRETKDNLLAGLFRGDGCIEKSNQGDYYNVNYATVSQILAEGADLLLREKGMLSSIKKIHTAKTKVDAWSLNISESENVKRLLPLFTERQRGKVSMEYLDRKRSIASPAYVRFKNLALLPIKEIKQTVKPTEVYSLETSRHWYMASWGILTHNCFPKDMAAFISFADSLTEQLEKRSLSQRKATSAQGRPDPAFMKVLKKGIGVLKAAEDYNVELLKAQGLNIDDVSKHNKEIIVQKRKSIRNL